MAQKYKVYFANRPVVFSNMESRPAAAFGTEVFVSQGKSDTAWIENAIAKGARSIHVLCNNVEESWNAFTEQFRHVPAAGGVVSNNRNEVLFIYRLEKWDLPKGKIEDGEAQDMAALREVEEECAIQPLKLGELILTTYHTYIQDGQPILKSTVWYAMRYEGNAQPQPQLAEGITKAQWIAATAWAPVKSNTYPSVLDVLEAFVATGGSR